jgi:moderate conductance mechanosensitive channel
MENLVNWLTPEFWAAILQRSVAWAITAVPAIAVVLLLAAAALKLLALGCRRLAARGISVRAGEPAHMLREQEKRAETLLGIVQKAGRIAIGVFVGMLVLMQVGVNIAPLIAGAGILGLAVGFGAQELVRDIITGFFILMENHMRVGDVAVINGTGGLVESIGLRTIVLRDVAGVVHIFQNGKIGTLSNMTKEWSAMVFDVGVAYKEDTDKVVEVMRDVAEALRKDEAFGQKILEPAEIFGVDSFADSAVVIKARIKTQPIEQWAVGREYRRRLKKAFDAEGIEIPFPHRTLYFGEASPPFQTLPLQASPARPATERGVPEPERPRQS